MCGRSGSSIAPYSSKAITTATGQDATHGVEVNGDDWDTSQDRAAKEEKYGNIPEFL
jgi:hypothetical protein